LAEVCGKDAQLLEDPNANPRNAAEVQILWELRQALRRRTVHVSTSLSFQSRAAMLDSRGSTATAARSGYPVKTMLRELSEEIEHGLERVSEAVQWGELKLDGAKVKVRRLAAQRTPPELKDIRRELYKAYPRVQFPDLIMAVDAETHFSAEILGRPADNETELAGAATYVHTHGWQGIFSDRSIMITQRRPGPAIDGILGQALSKIARVYTDTHGFSAYGASLGWTLGVLMCPRLKNFNDRRLHVPRGGHILIPDNLKDVVLADISLKSIEKGWAGHLKVADAVMSGRLSATTAVEVQGAARHSDASFRAGHPHGLLLRTNDLLRSYTDPDYRREKLRYLNHNERTHQLQRQIRHTGSGSTRGKRQEELEAQSHCLALCTNLVMAYNTSHLQRTLDTWRKQSGREVDASTQ
jgi:hypothetical protein